jgi:YD repeat-containing protein
LWDEQGTEFLSSRTVEETHPDNGLTSYLYNDAGAVTRWTDARGVLTDTSYDELYRPLGSTFSDGTPTITYTYDQGTDGIGRLRSVSNSTATSTYSYDAMGAVTREDKTINGQAFYTTYTYNLAGQVLTQRLPNGKVVTNAYDSLKRLTSITSDWVDANHPAVLATNFVYHPSGAVTSVDYGNNTRSTRTFNTGLQLKTIQEGPIGNPGAFLNLQYNYDEGVSNNGRIMSIVDYQDRTKDLSFTYDRLYRLATAQTAGSHWGLSWTYDRYGNRLAQSATKGAPPTNTLTVSEATNRVNGWTYDAAGNTLNDGHHTYTYNALNQLTTMDGGAIQG